MILSAPGQSLGASVARAPAAVILVSPGVAVAQSYATAPPAAIRVSQGTASGLAIAAGLGELITPVILFNRLAFASTKPRQGTILNPVRQGTILNPVRRGKVKEIIP